MVRDGSRGARINILSMYDRVPYYPTRPLLYEYITIFRIGLYESWPYKSPKCTVQVSFVAETCYVGSTDRIENYKCNTIDRDVGGLISNLAGVTTICMVASNLSKSSSKLAGTSLTSILN